MVCKVCTQESSEAFIHNVLCNYKVHYYHCSNCGFMQTEHPYWLDEAYNASINKSDTGLMMRNIFLSKSASTLLFFLFGANNKYLDFAGGYGVFTRLMRDIGFDFYTIDPYTPNLLARGFDYNPNDKIALITTFESFEHFVDPIQEIEKMLLISRNIFFSTQLIPQPVPLPDEWSYYGFNHGQHIAFYSHKTLKFIAEKYTLNLYSIRGYHLLTTKKISNLYFKFLIAGGRFGLYRLVKLFLKTKTFDDYKRFSQEING